MQGQRVRAAARGQARQARPAVRCQAGATAAPPAGERTWLVGCGRGAGAMHVAAANARRQLTAE